MTASDHLARCITMRGGVTESEAAIIDDFGIVEKRADMYTGICRGVAEALGLPTEGEGSSWSDLPAKVRVAVLLRPVPAAPNALREALEPFAKMDIAHFDNRPDKHPLFQSNATMITLGDIRRARAALGTRKEGE